MKNYETKISRLKEKILIAEDDLLKLRAQKAALERQRDMEAFNKLKGTYENDKKRHKTFGLHP